MPLRILNTRFHRLSSLLSRQPRPSAILSASISRLHGRNMSATTKTGKDAAKDTKQDPTTFTLEEYNNVPVTVQGLAKDQLKEWQPFKDWITTLTASLKLQAEQKTHPFHENPFALKSIHIDSFSMFGKRIGFLKLTADVSNADHKQLPGVIFLRGPAVAMLVVLIPDDAPSDDEAYVLLTVQPRIATGSLGFVELPAGMMDGSSNFAGAAAQEIKEELGLTIAESELVCLTDRVAEIRESRRGGGGAASITDLRETLPYAMYPSAGGCDEHIKIMLHERRESREQLKNYQGKATGLREAGEMITLKMVPLKDLWIEGGMDSKALAAVTLYQQLKAWDKEQKKT